MATNASTPAFQASADLNLWFKIRSGDILKLSDMPEIIQLRWSYFRDNWEFLKPQVINEAGKYLDPDYLQQQIKDFSDFIDKQRYTKPSLNPFADSFTYYRYYAIFDSIEIDNIELSNQERDLITNKRQIVQNYSKSDFIRIKKLITEYRDRLADIGGLTDEAYNEAMSRSAIPTQTVASITDLNLMLTLQTNISNVDFVLANLFAVDTALDPFALARSNANNPEINIGQYRSGRLVKLNYGEDLESLANRYFNDPNKWIDIAIANGLKPPYIDEVGQRLFLISNGDQNQINIANTDITGNLNIDKFYINQPIVLQSNVEKFPDQRTIIDIRQIPISGEIILQLDGAADLGKYKLSEGANIRVFLPNTINSSFFVLIPSNEPLPDARQDEVPWFLSNSAQDEKRQKVDLAIDENGELNFSTNGDFSLSYGLANAVQAMRLKIITELGSLRYHPDFGLVNIVGSKNQNLDDLKGLIIDSITSMIKADPRFDRVESLNVQYLVDSNSNTAVAAMNITLSVRLAGGSTVIPISFTVTK
jgi:hypothetical protein